MRPLFFLYRPWRGILSMIINNTFCTYFDSKGSISFLFLVIRPATLMGLDGSLGLCRLLRCKEEEGVSREDISDENGMWRG